MSRPLQPRECLHAIFSYGYVGSHRGFPEHFLDEPDIPWIVFDQQNVE